MSCKGCSASDRLGMCWGSPALLVLVDELAELGPEAVA